MVIMVDSTKREELIKEREECKGFLAKYKRRRGYLVSKRDKIGKLEKVRAYLELEQSDEVKQYKDSISNINALDFEARRKSSRIETITEELCSHPFVYTRTFDIDYDSDYLYTGFCLECGKYINVSESLVMNHSCFLSTYLYNPNSEKYKQLREVYEVHKNTMDHSTLRDLLNRKSYELDKDEKTLEKRRGN